MMNWQVRRHQVAIAGWVVDGATGKPVAGAGVEITAMPAAFKERLKHVSLSYGKRWTRVVERPDRTCTRPDGLFYFLDLPDGNYTLRAAIPSFGSRYGKVQQPAVVSHDAKGNTKVAFVKCALQPTAVKGQITGSGHKSGVVLAEVRVKGSGERTFTDAQGLYAVTGIELGNRTLLVHAQGYRSESLAVTLKEPGASETRNFNLTRESG